jgi:carbonic anhydrase
MIKLLLLFVPHLVLSWDYKFSGSDWPGICSTGTSQTPINIDINSTVRVFSNEPEYAWIHFQMSENPLQANHDAGGYKFLGAFGEMNMMQGNLPVISTNLVNFHFHSPSENFLNGQQFDLEMHIVMQDKDQRYNFVVFGVLFKVENNAYNSFINKVIEAGDKHIIINLAEAFTSLRIRDYLQFSGSLTTPPCTENVFWIIDTNVRSISQEQLRFFRGLWGEKMDYAGGNGNNRVLQPVNDRVITHFIGNSIRLAYLGMLVVLFMA